MPERRRPEPLTSWPLLPLPDADGRMEFPTLAKSVRESIQIILRTRPGERLMRPEFGGGLERMLNEQNTLSVRQEIKDLISDSLQRWEPRVVVDRIEVWESYLATLAALFDVLAAEGWRPGAAARRSGVSSASLSRFLERDRAAWRAFNEQRRLHGLKGLRSR